MNITVDRAVIEQALEALEEAENVLTWDGFQRAADALRVALGQQYMTNAAGELEPVTLVQTGVGIGKPEQEPVAMRYDFDGYGYKYIDSGSGSNWQTRIKDAEPLYEGPPQRKPLTEEEIWKIYGLTGLGNGMAARFARAIEAAHGIKD